MRETRSGRLTQRVGVGLALMTIASLARGEPRRGWSKPQALELAKEAIEARNAGDPQKCVQKDLASLAIEDHPYVRLHLSTCFSSTSRFVEALAAARDALAASIRNDDAELRRSAQARVAELLPKIPHVEIRLPKDARGITVTVDGKPVRPQLLRERIAVDPGPHKIEAERIEQGEAWRFVEKATLAPGDQRTIEVLLTKSGITEGERECLEQAKAYEEKLACIEHHSGKPNVRVGVQLSGYTDSLDVHVVSPSIDAAVVSPTGGWNLGGSYLVDVVTAASPDIVSMASRHFREQRHAGSLSGGYKIGGTDLQARGNVSREPDYLSMTGGGSVATELLEKRVTPRAGYGFTRDRIGLRDTPFSQYERNLTTHEIEGGVTLVLSSTTLLVLGVSTQLERGEQAKLYRHVPMFDPATASSIEPGEPIDSVNQKRLSLRPREVLPRERDRYAIGARVNHRLVPGTIRVEERLYTDSWGVKATTTDLRYLHDLNEHLRVGPHLRYHLQSEASFYRLAYPALPDPLTMLPYRTGDRELSRMMTITAGGSARIALSSEGATTRYAIVLSGEAMWSKFFQSLFVTSRTAVYGSLGFEVEL